MFGNVLSWHKEAGVPILCFKHDYYIMPQKKSLQEVYLVLFMI